MVAYTTTETQPSSLGIELQYSTPPGGTQDDSTTITPRMLDPEHIGNDAAPPRNAVTALQRWNHPRINRWRVFATFWSFVVLGMNDGSYGALIPYLEKYYDLTYTIVSLIFLSPFAGYTLASFTNNLMHVRFGQRGIAIIGPLCHLVSFAVMTAHPPYPVIIIMFIFIGFGNGLVDAAWCAWIGNMANANQVSGFLQACYALGATVAPTIATSMFSKGGLEWYSYYYIMAGGATLELVTSAAAFWTQTGVTYRAEHPLSPNTPNGRTREALKSKITWIFSVFIFTYMGAEISVGGWIVTFMTKVRNASATKSSITATGFWAGMTVGRIGLPFLTVKLGEFYAVLLYVGICVGLELIFWLVPNLIVSAVAVAFLGVFFGPLFPTAVIMVTKLLPKHLHVGSIGFCTAIGGSGGAIFPFTVGAIAQAKGIKTLQPIILALLAVICACWILQPRKSKQDHEGFEEPEVGRG